MSISLIPRDYIDNITCSGDLLRISIKYPNSCDMLSFRLFPMGNLYQLLMCRIPGPSDCIAAQFIKEEVLSISKRQLGFPDVVNIEVDSGTFSITC